jgi:anaerobic magnesium-protoporphyrin IX monomethyl ester cyclase
MKILFLIPPTLQFEDFIHPPKNVGTIEKSGRQFGLVLTDLPIGIISLSAYLKKHLSVKTEAIDFNIKLNKVDYFDWTSYLDYFESELAAYKSAVEEPPTHVGISALFTSSHQSIIDLAQVSKKIFPDSKCIVGGNYPTAAYGSLLKDSENIDAICYGEGEKPLVELLKADNFEDHIRESPSWIDRKKALNPLRRLEHQFIVDLDEIPPYDYDCVDVDGYRINPNSSRYNVKERYKLSKADSADHAGEETTGKIEAIGAIQHSMPIMTSRGCPFKCTFCASHVAHGREMRYHSLDRVVKDAKRLIEKYGIDGVVIQDDHFMGGKQRPYDIVASLRELGLGMYFQNALAIYALDLPFLQLLKQSGVDSLVLPLESGSSRVLKELMRKPLKLDVVPRVLSDCREAGIFTDVNIIIGMPGETKDDVEESRAFLKTLYADWFRIFAATPIAGSDMYIRCVSEGLFQDSELNANYKRPVISTGNLSAEQILEYTYLLNIELNFIHNSNIRLKKFDVALESFKNVIRVKPDHAIAFYAMSICYEGLGQVDLQRLSYEKFLIYSQKDPFWEKYVEHFNLMTSVETHG